MIKGIMTQSPFLQVVNNSSMPYINSGPLSSGTMRYNTNTQNIEVYDGHVWHSITNGYPSIALSPEAEDLLNWMKLHRIEVEEEKRLRDSHPAVKKAWEQYQVVKTLSQEHENV